MILPAVHERDAGWDGTLQNLLNPETESQVARYLLRGRLCLRPVLN